MRFCERCGAMNEDNSRFCIACGQPVNADDPGFAAPMGEPAPMVAPMPDPMPVPATAPMPVAASYETSEFPPWQDGQRVGANEAAAAEPDGFDEDLAAIDERLGNMEQLLDKLVGQFEDKIARNEHEASVLRQVSAEVEEYRNGLYEKLTMPFIRDIINVRAGMESMLARHGEQGSVPADEVSVFIQMLADTLTKHSVEIVESERGDEFLTFKHKAVGQVATTDPNLHGRIAEVDGESYRLGDQYIAPALVKLYTLDQGAGDESAN